MKNWQFFIICILLAWILWILVLIRIDIKDNIQKTASMTNNTYYTTKDIKTDVHEIFNRLQIHLK